MAANKFTTQTPISGQSIKTVIAERVYVAPADTVYASPTAKLNGTDPVSTWVDLGVVQNSKATIDYSKEVKEIVTGIDKVRRGSYVAGKTAKATFTLEQFDVTVLERVTGLTSAVLGSPAIGKTLYIGQEDVVERAILFLGSNKVDGKEMHTYCKKANLSFAIKDADDARVLEVTADLYTFLPVGQTVEALWTLHIID